MQISLIFRTLGLLLILLSSTFIPPLLVELGYQDGDLLTFILSIIITLSLGFILWFPFRRIKLEPRTQDGFLIVVLFWFATSLIGALPFYWMLSPTLSLTDAIFESTSGITTTGATILTHIESLPHSILYYRQQLQFLGGISIILLAIAMLPTLRVGGMQLFRSEFSNMVKDDKLMPRMRQAAKAIWMVYLLLILLCLLCYRLAGMSWFDAITHSFSTVSTGGFSTHDASLGYFQNPSIKLIALFFMMLGAINFNLHFLAFKKNRSMCIGMILSFSFLFVFY